MRQNRSPDGNSVTFFSTSGLTKKVCCAVASEDKTNNPGINAAMSLRFIIQPLQCWTCCGTSLRTPRLGARSTKLYALGRVALAGDNDQMVFTMRLLNLKIQMKVS